jgi:hypothetical protein
MPSCSIEETAPMAIHFKFDRIRRFNLSQPAVSAAVPKGGRLQKPGWELMGVNDSLKQTPPNFVDGCIRNHYNIC